MDGVAAGQRLRDGVRERFFAVHILAGFHGLDGDLGVPVIGRRDDNGIDVRVVEYALVFHRGLARREGGHLGGVVEPAAIDIAHADDLDVLVVASLDETVEEPGPLATRSDDGHPEPVIGTEYAAP